MAPPSIQYKELRVHDYLSLLAWRRQLRGILLTIDVWRAITGETNKPILEDMPDERIYRKECDKWRKLNNAAMGWMILTLEDFNRQSIERFTDPLEALADLFKRFPPPFITFDEFRGAVAISIEGAVVNENESEAAKYKVKGKGKEPEGTVIVTTKTSAKYSKRSKEKSNESGEPKKGFMGKIRSLRGSAEENDPLPEKESLTRNSAMMAMNDDEPGPAPMEEQLKPARYEATSYVVVPQRSASLEQHEYGGDGSRSPRRHYARGHNARPSAIRLEKVENREMKEARHDGKDSRSESRAAREGRADGRDSRATSKNGRHDGRESKTGGRDGRFDHRPSTKQSNHNFKGIDQLNRRNAQLYLMSGALPAEQVCHRPGPA